MSYHYGFNGNDVRWEHMPYSWTCLTCEGAIKDGADADTLECDGHTHRYTFGRGYGSLYHDTNRNFIRSVGNVPLDVYSTEYLAEWAASLAFDRVLPSDRGLLNRILRELAEDERLRDAVGAWGTYDAVCYYADGEMAVVRFNGRVYALPVDYETPEDDEDGDSRAFVHIASKKHNGWTWYFDECLRAGRNKITAGDA